MLIYYIKKVNIAFSNGENSATPRLHATYTQYYGALIQATKK